ncbi:hypothetical protein, partial [Actinomadura hibisca]|uniref:hypothetical protein n=1 Tax=Actinomadura hibisca TaxID=68565 RepID=UPI001C3F16CA
MIKGVTVEIHELRAGAEPAGWTDFQQAEGLDALWSHELLRALAEPPGAPALLGVVRDAAGICAAVCGAPVQLLGGARSGPVVLDLRLPGQAHGPAWRFAARVPAGRRRGLLRAAERAAVRHLGWGG